MMRWIPVVRPIQALALIGMALLLGGGTVSTARANTALTVSPPLMEMSVAAGGDRAFTLTVTNGGDTSIRLQAAPFDMDATPEGQPIPRDAGTSLYSLAAWLTLSDTDFSLNPGEQKAVKCRVQVPSGQTGGRYGLVLFLLKQDATVGGRAMRLEARTGTVLLLTIPHTERPALAVGPTDFSVSRDAKTNDVIFRATLHNTGNIHVRATGDLILRDASDRLVTRMKLDSGTGTVLPGGARVFTGTLAARRAKAGAYRAETRFSATGVRAITSKYDFTLKARPTSPRPSATPLP